MVNDKARHGLTSFLGETTIQQCLSCASQQLGFYLAPSSTSVNCMMRAKLLVVFGDWFNHAQIERKLPEGWCRMDSGFFSVVVAMVNWLTRTRDDVG